MTIITEKYFIKMNVFKEIIIHKAPEGCYFTSINGATVLRKYGRFYLPIDEKK